MTARKSISKSKRFEIFKRDGFACQYCGAHPPGALLHVDHIVPVVAGGSNEIDNLITSCEACNLGKGVRSLDVVPEGLADKAARIQESEAQLAGYSAALQAQRDRIEDAAWQVVSLLTGQDHIARADLQSIKVFLRRLPTPEVLEAAEIALAQWRPGHGQLFRYFCGVCWRKIKGD